MRAPIQTSEAPTEVETSSRWRLAAGAILGGTIGYSIAVACGATRSTVLPVTIWVGYLGIGIADVFRWVEGRVRFDRMAFDARWGKGPWIEQRRIWSDNRTGYAAILILMAILVLVGAVFDRTHPSRILMALIGTALLGGGAWMARTQLVDWAKSDQMVGTRTTIGTVLLVLGIGLVAANLPDAFRYIVQEESAVDDVGMAVALGIGAMCVTGGWLLRRPIPE